MHVCEWVEWIPVRRSAIVGRQSNYFSIGILEHMNVSAVLVWQFSQQMRIVVSSYLTKPPINLKNEFAHGKTTPRNRRKCLCRRKLVTGYGKCCKAFSLISFNNVIMLSSFRCPTSKHGKLSIHAQRWPSHLICSDSLAVISYLWHLPMMSTYKNDMFVKKTGIASLYSSAASLMSTAAQCVLTCLIRSIVSLFSFVSINRNRYETCSSVFVCSLSHSFQHAFQCENLLYLEHGSYLQYHGNNRICPSAAAITAVFMLLLSSD